MTIIVEDGTIVANANSYVSTAQLTAYALARGYTLIGNPESLLIQAMDYIEALPFLGMKQQILQPLEYPRYKVWIDNYPLASNTIPFQLKNGEMETAIAIDQGNGPLQDQARNTEMEKVGELEVKYSTSSSSRIINVKIRNALYKLLSVGGFGVIKVSKA